MSKLHQSISADYSTPKLTVKTNIILSEDAAERLELHHSRQKVTKSRIVDRLIISNLPKRKVVDE